ncbi:MAG TPA: HAMP domain-containing sensor histidine kinase [Chryseolinea sp.]
MQLASQAGAKIHIDSRKVEPFVSNPTILKIISDNLLENAIIFNHQKTPVIKIEALSVDHGIRLTIQDNGIGIEPEILPHVYDMFFRGNERSKGNGLGLYIVKRAVNKLNGTIDIESVYGQGTTVRVQIPIEHG